MRRHLSNLALPVLVALVAASGCVAELGGGSDGTELGREELIAGRYTFERPEIGSIRVGGGSCTATLFGSARTVLTAAHCVDYRNAGPGRHGDFILEPRPGERYRYAIRQMVVFGTTFGSSRDDVALLQLAEAVPASVAVPDPPGGAYPASGSPVTIYGYGCQRRGGGGTFAKQAFSHAWGSNTYNLCPGDSGGPTLDGAGAVYRVNSAYIVGEGRDLFGDVVHHLANLRTYVDRWREGSPLVWVGAPPPPTDPPPSDPPPSDPPPSDPPPSDPPPSDPPPPPPPADPPPPPSSARCAAHADCQSCVADSYCGWCGGCVGLHLDRAGRIAGDGCSTPVVLTPWSCPAPGAPPPPPPPTDPVPPSAGACGPWSGLAQFTCIETGVQFARCTASGPEFLTCPPGYGCAPGSRELLCHWTG